MAAVLALAVILYLLGDTVSRGKLGAFARGTTKGVARTGGRATAAAARKSRAEYAAYLRSEAAPLRRTRRTARVIGKPVGKGARASWRGAREGVAEEMAKLSAHIEAARAEADAARVAAQDPAAGVARGRFGHSFDVAPTLDPEAAATGVTPRSEADLWQDPQPIRRPDGTPVTVCEVAAAGAALNPRAYDGRLLDDADPGSTDAPARPREGTRQEENPIMTMTSNGGPPVHVDNVPAWIVACDQLAKAGQQVHEAGVELGINGQAQGGLQDAIDILKTVAAQVSKTYTPLVEASSNIPQGAEGITVGKARAQ